MTLAGTAGFEPRVPAALIVSAALHVAGFAVFLHYTEKVSREGTKVLSDVELLMEEEQREDKPMRQRKAEAPSMKDFLKLALPAVPKLAAPLEIKAPEQQRTLMEIPKLKLDEDRGRVQTPPKLAALDLGSRRMELAKVAQPLVGRESSPMMAMPKLEEVGTQKASRKVIQMAALSEENRERLQAAPIKDLSSQLDRRKTPAMAAPLLQAEGDSALGRLARMLPAEQPIRLEPQAAEAGPQAPVKRFESVKAATLPPREERAELQRVEKQQAVTIEGPIKARRIVSRSVPQYPQWARDAGIVEADVAIKFFVSAGGFVLEDRISVERTSGYGRLDRLAVDHLKEWRFEPLALGGGNEWGVITFRFILE